MTHFGLPVAPPEEEAGGQRGQDQEGQSGHPAPHRAAHVGVEGSAGPALQTQGLHVGAVLHLVALVVVDERLVQCQAPAAVHQVALGPTRLGGERTLDPQAGPRLRTNDVDHLQVPLVTRLHLNTNVSSAPT